MHEMKRESSKLALKELFEHASEYDIRIIIIMVPKSSTIIYID